MLHPQRVIHIIIDESNIEICRRYWRIKAPQFLSPFLDFIHF